jgi:hypothetical protein
MAGNVLGWGACTSSLTTSLSLCSLSLNLSISWRCLSNSSLFLSNSTLFLSLSISSSIFLCCASANSLDLLSFTISSSLTSICFCVSSYFCLILDCLIYSSFWDYSRARRSIYYSSSSGDFWLARLGGLGIWEWYWGWATGIRDSIRVLFVPWRSRASVAYCSNARFLLTMISLNFIKSSQMSSCSKTFLFFDSRPLAISSTSSSDSRPMSCMKESNRPATSFLNC